MVALAIVFAPLWLNKKRKPPNPAHFRFDFALPDGNGFFRFVLKAEVNLWLFCLRLSKNRM
jgi:hypothetical protein